MIEVFLVNPNSTRHPVAHPVHLHGHHYSVLSTGNSLSSNQNFPFLQPPQLCPLQGPSLLRTRLVGSKSKTCLGQFLETSTIHLAKIQCKLHQDLTLWSGEKENLGDNVAPIGLEEQWSHIWSDFTLTTLATGWFTVISVLTSSRGRYRNLSQS